MRDSLVRGGAAVLFGVGLMLSAGCGGSGQTVHFDVLPPQQPVQQAEPEAVKIVIEPFEDRRADKHRIGMRTHLWGGVTNFNVTGEKPGEVYAQALADRLRGSGWLDRTRTSSSAGRSLNFPRMPRAGCFQPI